MAASKKRASSIALDQIGTERQPLPPTERYDTGLVPQPRVDTLADEARKSAAVARAHSQWVESMGENTPRPTMDPTGPSAYPETPELIDASADQIDDLRKRVRDELGR